ncbi:helix-turn-helix transcriptional regulator [Embleya scabrispora]|uniref:helix-turn-helix transcriptional regulator n=1 Tax=Embleya scabrispora TaxID=159449 RepID=UPI00036A174B|nr:LuxR family transcriptional regulator [Embleya scabrispora]MYS78959.1 AAA family ATPase [Streptomyces sp. SID5474]
MLYGRDSELTTIERLLADAEEGRSGVLVIRGEPGIGKTALLDHVLTGTSVRTLRGTGVEYEAELPYAGLNLLLRPALGHLDRLPDPQRQALAAAFGLAAGERSEPMFVGLAVLSLLSEYAGDGPLLCVVDDAQWLDRASHDALVFAARRLYAEGIALIFAAREDRHAFPAQGLPELPLSALGPEHASALLDEHARDMSATTRSRVLAESRGNPLALIELPVSLAGERSGDTLRPGALPLTSRLQIAFHGQVTRLDERTGMLLLLAASDDSGDLGILLRAGAGFGAGPADLAAAEEASLIVVDDDRLRFRHPLIRAAVQQRAPIDRRLAAHRALAEAFDAPDHADRRAWHLAAAATGVDEPAAIALESTGERARERSGHLAAALAYEKAARLSQDVRARTRRLVLAAEAASEAGELDRARTFAERAQSTATDDAIRARLLHVRALSDFWQGAFTNAHELLRQGAALTAGSRPERAARMLLQSMHTAWYLGETEVCSTVRELAELDLPPTASVTPVVEFMIAAFPPKENTPDPRQPKGGHPDTERPDLGDLIRIAPRTGNEEQRDLLLACGVGLALGQDVDAHHIASLFARESRLHGGIGRLPTILFFVAEAEIFESRHTDALATASEGLRIAQDTGQQQWISQFESVLAYLAGISGDEEAAHRHADAALAGGVGSAMPAGAPWSAWALGLLDLGLGRPESALNRLERLAREPLRHHISATRSIPDLVEAAVRFGAPDRAREPLARFEQWAGRADQRWSDALVLRCHALLASDDAAEELWLAALARHESERRPLERARTGLLYGEWLRRLRRKTDARDRLRTALEEFDRLDARSWADRARTELAAIGGSATPQGPQPAGVLALLTPQELQITRLAAQGLSNRDIAAQLFLSPRTVGHHLYKAYPKLAIVSRTELTAIPELAALTG